MGELGAQMGKLGAEMQPDMNRSFPKPSYG